MNKKQRTFFGSAVLLMAALVTLVTACFSPHSGDEGTLTLNFGGGNGANRSIAYEPGGIGPGADVGELEFRIHLSGPGGNLTETVQGAGTVRLSLVPGRWTIQVDAYYQGMVYAVSDPITVNISAGENNNAAVQMRPATKAYNDDDFGPNATVKYMYFSANDSSTALQTYLTSIIGTAGNYAIIVEGTQHTLNTVAITASNVQLSLRGSGTVSLASNGCMFGLPTTPSGNKLILRGLKLVGRNTNTASLVQVNSGEFVMHAGEISGNKGPDGGVFVAGSGSRFTMNGGTISGNQTTSKGGGVGVYNATFTMSGGTISGNQTISPSGTGGGVYIGNGSRFDMSGGSINGNNQAANGAGVYVEGPGSQFTMSGSAVISGNTASTSGGGVYVTTTGGTVTFTMTGGTISGNRANSTSGNEGGGGVYVYNNGGTTTTFTMSGGTIGGNNQASRGAGVSVCGSGTQFTMSGSAVISDNTTTSSGAGGGVYVTINGQFTMNGGAISDNTATNLGGGVYVNGVGGPSTFTMTAGTISRNTANYRGGGVYDAGSTTFTMSGGTIYGSDAGANANIAPATNGVSLYEEASGTSKYGDTTPIISSGNYTDATLNGHL